MSTSMFPSENQTIEYKESWRDEYLKWICGFANAQGGTLYIGINDQREVVGIARSKELMEQLPNMISMTMGIMANIDLHQEEEKEYITIHVSEQSMPIAYKGKYYYRTGSTLQEFTGIALQDFMMKKMNLTWDAQIIEQATIDDIDPEAISYFVRQGIQSKRLPISAKESSIESILSNLNLLRNGKLTLAALLLFGKNPQYYVTSARFRIGRFGSSDVMLISQDMIEGNLIQMADKVMVALDKYLIRPIHYEGMQRIEPLEIPEEGLREIIYNAIVHKDYRGADIQMKIYADYIHLWNEGSLPENITVDDLFRKHDSVPRNRLIATAFYYAGFIESWGRGFQTIKETFEAEKLSVPKFVVEQGGLAAVIQRERFVASTINVGVNVSVNGVNGNAELTDRQKVIYNFLLATGVKDGVKDGVIKSSETTSTLSKNLQIPFRSVQRTLSDLQHQGLIIRVGGRKTGHWEVVKKEETK